MDTTGTEALDGSTPPPIDSSMQGNPDAQPQQGQPAQQPAPDLTGGQSAPPDLGAPDAPPAATVAPPARRSGVAGLLDAVADILSPSQQSTRVRDANGNMQTVAGKPLTRGQQWAHVGLEALQGAATAASAPSGPGHISRGVAAAVGGQIQQQQQAQQAQNEQADHDFAVQQKAKQDNLNYQLGTRDLAAKTFELTRRQVAATQDDITYAQKQEDREKQLGSFDLGTYAGAMDLHQVMEQQPKFFDRLNKGLITAVPVYDADGKRQGLHIFERRAEVGQQKAAAGTQFPVWTPGSKPGEAPHMEWKTAADGQYSNDDITRFGTAAMNDSLNYAKTNADIQHTKAQTGLAGAQAVEAVANAGRANAEARKAKIEANNEQDSAVQTSPNEANAEAMVEGLTSPNQLSKRAKDYNAMLPMANAYSMKKYGVPFDAEMAEGKYQARVKTIQAYGSGKEGDQIQTWNQFLGHAGSLASQIDQLRNTNSPLLNTPLKDLRKAMGSDAYAKIEPLLYAVKTEHANFLNNNHALHEQDIAEGNDMLSDTQTLAQSEGAIKAFAGTAIVRAGALNDRYRRVVQRGDVPDLLSNNSRGTIQRLGLVKEAKTALGTAWDQQPQTQQLGSSPSNPQQTARQPQGQQAPQQTQTAPASFNWGAHPVAQ